LFDNIENYANKQKEMREKEKELRQEIKKIVKDNHKTENIWKDINNLPI
jgi:cytolysin (calcineurin-like family phosphatase)